MTPQTWDCTDARLSLGVYVLGAIDPAERALVDAHLATCRDCRDELAGLAGPVGIDREVTRDGEQPRPGRPVGQRLWMAQCPHDRFLH